MHNRRTLWIASIVVFLLLLSTIYLGWDRHRLQSENEKLKQEVRELIEAAAGGRSEMEKAYRNVKNELESLKAKQKEKP